ncbi:hypothetical protein DdX_16401 [Ditylenchus destructor]|uniref:Uncharacterized protein n=1 Tax=Ditylenchus destructor TaxID=166010 RepID=A0AAD4MNN2_9BILA|nr:hypothetical protein DdX_16401 [Ditylenchus destructor]
MAKCFRVCFDETPVQFLFTVIIIASHCQHGSSLYSIITGFLPKDDITDLMLMSRNFNAFVTPRLQKIDEEMATMNQSMVLLVPRHLSDRSFCSLISHNVQGILKRCKPIGTEAKKRMRKVFQNRQDIINYLRNATSGFGILDSLKKRMSLQRFEDKTFLYILCVLVSTPKFRQVYNVRKSLAQDTIQFAALAHREIYNRCPNPHPERNPSYDIEIFNDNVRQVWLFCNQDANVYDD